MFDSMKGHNPSISHEVIFIANYAFAHKLDSPHSTSHNSKAKMQSPTANKAFLSRVVLAFLFSIISLKHSLLVW
jgi:hypothetical protein